MLEISWSTTLAQAYSTHRYLWDGRPQKRVGHRDFQASVVDGTLRHHTVQPPSAGLALHEHRLVQQPEGSVSDGTSRRKVLGCRSCPPSVDGKRSPRLTTLLCQEYDIGLHPSCFQAYHAKVPAPLPARVRRRLSSPEGSA